MESARLRARLDTFFGVTRRVTMGAVGITLTVNDRAVVPSPVARTVMR